MRLMLKIMSLRKWTQRRVGNKKQIRTKSEKKGGKIKLSERNGMFLKLIMGWRITYKYFRTMDF